MNEIASNLTSISWWFTAVFVAIIINVISSYVPSAANRVWRYAKSKFNEETKRIADSNAKFLEQLKSDEALRRFLFEAEVRANLLSLHLFILGLSLAALGLFIMLSSMLQLPAFFGRPVGIFSIVVIYYSMDRFALGHALSKVLIQVEKDRMQKNVA